MEKIAAYYYNVGKELCKIAFKPIQGQMGNASYGVGDKPTASLTRLVKQLLRKGK